MGDWLLLRGEEAVTNAVWRTLAHDGHVRAFTQLPQFNYICLRELAWQAMCLVRVSPPTVVPMVLRKRRGGLAVRVESLAYGLAGGPITGYAPDERAVREIARALARCALEVFVYPSRGTFAPHGWDRIDFAAHEVPLESPHKVWSQASRSCRGAARHAQRCGVHVVEVAEGPWVEAITVLHEQQQRARKARRYSLGWISSILREMPDHTGLWAAIHDGRPVAALLVGWCKTAAVALLSTGDPGARPLKAGNLLYLTVLEELARRGMSTLDLGGSRSLPALEAFKRSLGGVSSARPFYLHRHPGLSLYQRVVGNTPGLTAGD
ncbi:GNAT family N-acetyltransferase [Candidatus Fermentibacteria bacterium]|nr:GNAT family N-acetyltransferase [Candidatus Fermentibacteria bacterium]